jgi:MFS family permease
MRVPLNHAAEDGPGWTQTPLEIASFCRRGICGGMRSPGASVLPPSIPSMDHDPRLFFQVAAALIPTLVFGGFLTDRLRPPEDWDLRRRSWPALLLMFCAFFVLLAEVTAIHATLTGRAAAHETWIVALAVVGATVALLAGLVWPWVAPLFRHPLGRVGAGTRVVLALGIVGIVVMSALVLASAVRGEQTLQALTPRSLATLG